MCVCVCVCVWGGGGGGFFGPSIGNQLSTVSSLTKFDRCIDFCIKFKYRLLYEI